MTFVCIFSGFMGAFFAMACGATGGKSANADDLVDDGDDITPIDDVILTKRILDCPSDMASGVTEFLEDLQSCQESNINGTEVVGLYYMRNGQYERDCSTNQNCDSIRLVIIE